MLFELEEYEDDLDYRSIPLSIKTPCSEALALIVKKFHLPGEVSDYYLVEVSEENEGKASLVLSIGIFSPFNPPLPSPALPQGLPLGMLDGGVPPRSPNPALNSNQKTSGIFHSLFQAWGPFLKTPKEGIFGPEK